MPSSNVARHILHVHSAGRDQLLPGQESVFTSQGSLKSTIVIENHRSLRNTFEFIVRKSIKSDGVSAELLAQKSSVGHSLSITWVQLKRGREGSFQITVIHLGSTVASR